MQFVDIPKSIVQSLTRKGPNASSELSVLLKEEKRDHVPGPRPHLLRVIDEEHQKFFEAAGVGARISVESAVAAKGRGISVTEKSRVAEYPRRVNLPVCKVFDVCLDTTLAYALYVIMRSQEKETRGDFFTLFCGLARVCDKILTDVDHERTSVWVYKGLYSSVVGHYWVDEESFVVFEDAFDERWWNRTGEFWDPGFWECLHCGAINKTNYKITLAVLREGLPFPPTPPWQQMRCYRCELMRKAGPLGNFALRSTLRAIRIPKTEHWYCDCRRRRGGGRIEWPYWKNYCTRCGRDRPYLVEQERLAEERRRKYLREQARARGEHVYGPGERPKKKTRAEKKRAREEAKAEEQKKLAAFREEEKELMRLLKKPKRKPRKQQQQDPRPMPSPKNIKFPSQSPPPVPEKNERD